MKSKGFSIGIIFLVLMVCTTCTKDEALLTPKGEPSALKSAPVEHAIFEVTPTGDDDTDNIIAAFEAAIVEGPGTIVYLAEGTYYTSRPIVIANFNGTFMGAGKDKTIVQNIDNDAFPLISDEFPLGIGGGLLPELFCFYSDGANMSTTLSISDITFKFEGKAVVHEEFWWGGVTDRLDNLIVIMGNVNGLYDLSSINVTLKNVNFEGEIGPEFVLGINNQFGVFLVGEALFDSDDQYYEDDRIKVNSVIEDCNFSSHTFGVGIYFPVDSKVLIKNNHFENILRNGIRYNSPENSQIEIYKNIFDFDGWYAINLFNNSGVSTSQNLVHHNDFNLEGGADGIGIYDAIGGTLNVEISTNNFNLNTFYGGIYNIASEGILIRNNKFSGNAAYGVDAGWSGPVNNMVILGNNFNNLTALWSSIGLGPLSSNCTVVGGNNYFSVYDVGTDNILTGVNNQGNPPGPEIRAAMEEKLKKIHPTFDPVR